MKNIQEYLSPTNRERITCYKCGSNNCVTNMTGRYKTHICKTCNNNWMVI